jgi:hypothetical protein
VKLVEGSKDGVLSRIQHALTSSEAMSSMFDSVSKSTVIPKRTKSLFRLFRICAHCNHFERLGEDGDGGYLTCMDHHASNPPVAAFSFGIAPYDKWSEHAVTSLGVQNVFQYDCTIEAPSVECPRCHFFKKCIRGSDQLTANRSHTWTLQEAIDNTDHQNAADDSLIMKMDIEGSEWDALKEASKKTLKKFKQITIEYHGLDVKADHDKYIMSQMNLKFSGFEPVHLHGNNYQGMFTEGDYSLPKVLEVTYLRVPGAKRCVADQQFHSLNSPNNPFAEELPAARLEAH